MVHTQLYSSSSTVARVLALLNALDLVQLIIYSCFNSAYIIISISNGQQAQKAPVQFKVD